MVPSLLSPGEPDVGRRQLVDVLQVVRDPVLLKLLQKRVRVTVGPPIGELRSSHVMISPVFGASLHVRGQQAGRAPENASGYSLILSCRGARLHVIRKGALGQGSRCVPYWCSSPDARRAAGRTDLNTASSCFARVPRSADGKLLGRHHETACQPDCKRNAP